MIAKLKGWLIAAGSVLLIIVSLGTWAVLERKAKQFQQRRADRAEKTAKATEQIFHSSKEAEKRYHKAQKEGEKILRQFAEKRQKAKKKRQKALERARNPHKTPWEWLNERFSK